MLATLGLCIFPCCHMLEIKLIVYYYYLVHSSKTIQAIAAVDCRVVGIVLRKSEVEYAAFIVLHMSFCRLSLATSYGLAISTQLGLCEG